MGGAVSEVFCFAGPEEEPPVDFGLDTPVCSLVTP